MTGIGVFQDGFPFTNEELERGTPRFWWSSARKRAFDKALARRGGARHRHDGDSSGSEADDWHFDGSDTRRAAGTGAAAAAAYVATDGFEERHDVSGGGESFGSTDTGGSSDGGGGGE